MADYGIVLENDGLIELELNDNLYDLDISQTINPGTPSGGQDYNNLRNKPQINSVTLQSNVALSELDLRPIYYNTREGWNDQPDLVSENESIYIYTNYYINNKTKIPSMKIGDGVTLLSDLPFLSESPIDYKSILNKPSINSKPILEGDNSLEYFGIGKADLTAINKLFD